MEQKKYFFAVDLGATSGRTIVGSLSDGKFDLEELTRFDNNLIETGGHFYWDIYALYFEIIKGLKLVAQRGIHIQSIGIDTWGCDFVYVDKNGDILRNPMAYRDPHTMGIMEKYFDEKISKEKVYEKTGIQFMNFNSLFQMYAMRKAGNVALENADKILFIPDALSYMLTGNAICEYTVASTSQILNPMTGDFDIDLVESIGLKREQFGKMTHPATIIGTLTEEVQKITGLNAVPVIAVAGHDTASAVAAVPAKNEEFAYLSSGTWSLMGIETKNAIINEKSYELNFTNEGGIEGTTRFLKNICGMWIYERCRKEWKDEAAANQKDMTCLGHAELIAEAMKQPAFQSIINPDDTCFANPSEHGRSHQAVLRKDRSACSSELWRILPLHLRESCPPLSPGIHMAQGFRRHRSQCAPHHRWGFAQPISQPVYCQQLWCNRIGRSSGRHRHRQHHAPGKGIGLGKGYLGNAPDYRQLAGA